TSASSATEADLLVRAVAERFVARASAAAQSRLLAFVKDVALGVDDANATGDKQWPPLRGPNLGSSLPLRNCGAHAAGSQSAGRIRDLVGAEPGLTEKKMFGGLAFLLQGNMAVAASGQGGLLVRVDPEESDQLVSTSNARPMEMRGREMHGWLRVDTDDVAAR